MHQRIAGTLIALLLGLVATLSAWAAARVDAVRLSPAAGYSRIALELSGPVEFQYFTLRNPHRLVLDLHGVEPGGALDAASGQVDPRYPLISTLRSGLNRPGITRVVAELKAEARPEVFTLKPMGDYGHRVVVDLYPADSAPGSAAATAEQVENAIARASGKASVPARPAKTAAAKAAVREGSDRPSEGGAPVPAGEFSRLVTVAIDAGHGGVDPGAVGANGSLEKEITLSVARRLKAQIDRQQNMRAVLVRDGDYFIPLHERVNKARAMQADLFVSIHADAFLRPEARGSSVFALSEKGATSAAARWLAKRENDADLIGGINIDVKDVYLKRTLIDLSQTATIADSLKLGRSVLSELGEINDLHKPHVEQAGFAVLKAPDIPSILVETAFISNPEEEKRLLDDAYQERMAEAIANGIRRYFEKSPPLARSGVIRTF